MEVNINLDDVKRSVMPVIRVDTTTKHYILGTDVEIDEIMLSNVSDDKKCEMIEGLAFYMIDFYRKLGIIGKGERVKKIQTVDFAL